MASRKDTGVQRGFTLAELLVVISLLGVLSAVVVFAVGGISDRGQTSACTTDAQVLRTAEEAQHAAHSAYATEDGLVTAKLLPKASDLHDIDLSNGKYTIIALGACIGSGGGVANTAPGITVGSGGPAGVTVALTSSTGTPLEGGSADYSSGTWTPIGSTGTDGRVTTTMSSGSYHFRVDFRGQTMDSGIVTVASGSVVTFHTIAVTVRITGGANNIDRSQAPVAVRGSDGYWMSIDDTDANGHSVAELLPGDYDGRVDYNGQTSVLPTATVTATTDIDAPLTQTLIHTTANEAFVHRGNNGVWVDDGVAGGNGQLTISVLAGSYDFNLPAVGHSKGAPTLPKFGVAISGATATVTVP